MALIIIPEIIIIITILSLIILKIIFNNKIENILFFITAIFGTIASLTSLLLINIYTNNEYQILFGGRFVFHTESFYFKILFLLIALIIILISWERSSKNNIKNIFFEHCSEFYSILLTTICGAMFLVSSNDIITLYISLEMATIPIYILIAWNETSISGESGLKYALLGMFSSVFILLGFSYIYGATGETSFYNIFSLIQNNDLLHFISILLIIAIGFKMALVPFHMWIADVYYGASTTITAYLSVFSKILGLSLIIQLFYKIIGNHIIIESTFLISCIAAITMTVGNILAITQSNIKRIMAFSSISQAGYLLMGFIGGQNEGIIAIIYYSLVYIVSNLAAFCAIIYFERKFNAIDIKDYKNLSQVAPAMSLILLLALFSLAGIPPLSGFVGKFFLFSIAASQKVYWLVLLAAINSTISLYYYLNIIKSMYIEKQIKIYKPSIFNSSILNSTAFITTISIFLLTIIPFFYETIYINIINN